MKSSLKVVGHGIPWMVSLIALVYACWLASSRIIYDFAGAHEGDGFIYMGVGRGILNGLLPYRDLFETKPPGMFLISALSAWLFDDLTLGNIIQGLADIGMVILVILPVVPLVQNRRRSEKTLWLIGVFCTATAIMLYAATRAGGFQTESIGALFVIAYLALLATTKDILSWPKTVLASFLLAIAVGLKEPFILIAIAGGLMLAGSMRTFFWNVVIPIVLALLAGTLLLAALGYLGAYVKLYLPVMLGQHIGVFGSPWLRGFAVQKVASDLWTFSPPFFLLIAGSFILSWRIAMKESHRYGFWLVCLRYLAALYILIFTVGLGGEFTGHHFGFAVPLYACVLWIAIRQIVLDESHWKAAIGGALVVGSILLFVQPDYQTLLTTAEVMKANNRMLAGQIDTVLDACNVERYLIVGDFPSAPYAYTKHSPLGPGFFQYALNTPVSWRRPDPFFIESFVANIETTPLFIMPKNGERPIVKPIADYIGQNFTTEIPTCASPIAFSEEVIMQFRINTFTLKP